MGHVDERDPDLLLDRLELELHLLAELQVEGAERLVEEQDAGAIHERARERDALPLPARELARAAPLVAGEPDHREGLADAALAFRLRDLPDHQAVGDVVAELMCGNSA